MDAGHRDTEKKIEEIEKRISAEYRKAEKDIQKTLDDYLRRFETKDRLKQKALMEGQITEEEYKQWRVGQIMIGQRWNATRDRIVNDLNDASQEARNIAFGEIGDIYATNFNYGTYQVEKAARIDTDFTLYDKDSVRELMKNEDTFIPAPGRKVRRAINEGKQKAWDARQVQSVMMQGILQGKSIPDLASNLAQTVGESDRKAAIRNARTLVTGVQNAGRVASYDRANEMGIETQKQWLATLDNRTRHWHADLDGETVPNDEPFVNDHGEIMYPGDPAAEPANIFNCRCTLIASIKGFERDVSDIGLRNDKLEDMSYEEWKAGHYEQQAVSLTHQEELSEAIRVGYVQEYNEISNIPGSRISIVDNNANVSYTVRTKQELTEAANIIKDYAEEYSDRPSKWSGNIVVRNSILHEGDSGRKEWNCDITLIDIADDGVILHELLHSCSASYLPSSKFGLYRNIEEGTVDYLSSLICRENGVSYNVVYPNQVSVLEQLWKPLGYDTDIAFAKEIFNVDLQNRYNWLENKTKQVLKSKKASQQDYKETMTFIELLKGG